LTGALKKLAPSSMTAQVFVFLKEAICSFVARAPLADKVKNPRSITSNCLQIFIVVILSDPMVYYLYVQYNGIVQEFLCEMAIFVNSGLSYPTLLKSADA
jgi:hypothetical protein